MTKYTICPECHKALCKCGFSEQFDGPGISEMGDIPKVIRTGKPSESYVKLLLEQWSGRKSFSDRLTCSKCARIHHPISPCLPPSPHRCCAMYDGRCPSCGHHRGCVARRECPLCRASEWT